MIIEGNKTDQKFAMEVLKGLSSNPKYLSSKYFYDDAGDKLFQKIMQLEEYYLTRSEYEILETNRGSIFNFVEANNLELIDLGAGDGLKSKILINYLIEQSADFTYIPVDISCEILNMLKKNLNSLFPNLKIQLVCDEYFSVLESIGNEPKKRKLILFLGSNIGNMEDDEAIRFLEGINAKIDKGDFILIGFDLQKDPAIILKAYNDQSGVTRDFNLNLLKRINTELKANFNLSTFEHIAIYDQSSKEARSYLQSKIDQSVYLEFLNTSFSLKKNEKIHTETSRKYSAPGIKKLAEKSGFNIVKNYFDSDNYFIDSLWIK